MCCALLLHTRLHFHLALLNFYQYLQLWHRILHCALQLQLGAISTILFTTVSCPLLCPCRPMILCDCPKQTLMQGVGVRDVRLRCRLSTSIV